MAVETNQYAIAKLFKVRIFDLVTNQLIASLFDLKNTTFNAEGTVTYATGNRNAVQITSFTGEDRAMLTIEHALYDDALLGLQTGSSVETVASGTEINREDRISVTVADTASTTYTAAGTANAELKYLYIANADGTPGTELTQVSGAPAQSGEFSYDSGTKAITFFAGDAPAGSTLIANYNITVSDYKKIIKSVELGAKQVKVICDGLFKNKCNGTNYAGQLVIFKGQVSPSFEIALTESSEPAIQGFEINALSSCNNNNLFEMYIYNEDDIAA
jgi:hypothetical protein